MAHDDRLSDALNALTDEKNRLAAELAAANARADANCEAWVAESKRHVETADMLAALSARLERVRAILANWPANPQTELRAALGEDA